MIECACQIKTYDTSTPDQSKPFTQMMQGVFDSTASLSNMTDQCTKKNCNMNAHLWTQVAQYDHVLPKPQARLDRSSAFLSNTIRSTSLTSLWKKVTVCMIDWHKIALPYVIQEVLWRNETFWQRKRISYAIKNTPHKSKRVFRDACHMRRSLNRPTSTIRVRKIPR